MGKNFAHSIYGINKADKGAIVCPSAVDNSIRITIDDFSSEEEFLYWKALSDSDYRQAELNERPYTDGLLFLLELSDEAAKAPSAEDAMLSILTALESASSHALLQNALAMLTPVEKRRLLLNAINGLTVRQIGIYRPPKAGKYGR